MTSMRIFEFGIHGLCKILVLDPDPINQQAPCFRVSLCFIMPTQVHDAFEENFPVQKN